MPRASNYTLLSLTHYALIMGLDPLHFAGAFSDLRPSNSACNVVWYQHDWQDSQRISREHLALRIREAEHDLSDLLGFWPGPCWIQDERNPYPRMRQRELTGFGTDIRNRYKNMKLDYGYVITGGQRATDPLGTDVAYSRIDADNDGFDETAVFTIAGVDADLDVNEVRAYFKEYAALDVANTRTDPSSTGADRSWEVRPIRPVLSGTTLTVYINVWELFQPYRQETLQSQQMIDADAAVYVDELDFYREYNNPESQVEFLWGSDIPCTSGTSVTTCAVATQTGCFRVQDERNSIIVPSPGTYVASTESFTEANWSQGIEPDVVRFWYRCGYIDPRSGYSTLNDYWARIIAMLATARLEWPMCDCNNAAALSDRWREDKSLINPQRSFLVSETGLNNPLGTRTGEIEVWKAISKGTRRAIGQAVIT